jgi:hypothetical protein
MKASEVRHRPAAAVSTDDLASAPTTPTPRGNLNGRRCDATDAALLGWGCCLVATVVAVWNLSRGCANNALPATMPVNQNTFRDFHR